jgi:hypothetical protein
MQNFGHVEDTLVRSVLEGNISEDAMTDGWTNKQTCWPISVESIGNARLTCSCKRHYQQHAGRHTNATFL